MTADLHDVPTPALLLDIERACRNATRMTARVKRLAVSLRPHVKTHKCVEVARMQTAGHSGAITVSTLAEARAFLAAGFADILYAVPVTPARISEGMTLARTCGRFVFLTDSFEIPPLIEAAASRAGLRAEVAVKVDCGYGRCGIALPTLVLELVRHISSRRALRFAGLVTHAGHSYHAASSDERKTIAGRERDVLVALAVELRRDGIEVPCVSVGSTPTMTAVDHLRGVDEVRPGNYVFLDEFQASIDTCSPSDCALSVLSSVMHVDRQQRKLVLDAGAIALSKDRGAADVGASAGYGRVLDFDGADLGFRVTSLSQEHGVCRDVVSPAVDRLAVGSRVRISPNHACLTAAQHSSYCVIQDGRIVDNWPIHRGW